MRRILALCAVALLAVLGLAACSGSTPDRGATATATPAASAGRTSADAAPQRVLATLARIDAGTWPPKDGSGTQGGRNFGNFEGHLPTTDARGRRAKYTEWDVNVKKPGRGRDAERIITGADGGAWYTLDHYETFTRIR